MVGAGIAASYAGWVRSSTGDYLTAWLTAGALCLGAALACLTISAPRKSALGAIDAATGHIHLRLTRSEYPSVCCCSIH
jgi:hypothetical protein